MQPFLLLSTLFPSLTSRAAPSSDGLFADASGRQPLKPKAVAVFSISNDNQSFLAHFTLRKRLWEPHSSWLSVGGQVLPGAVFDGVENQNWTEFSLDAAQARAVADRYGVPLRLRSPLGEGLVSRWSVLSGTTVRLRLVNEGAPVGLWVNGVPTADSAGYGQLTFQVFQDGVELAPVSPMGMYIGPLSVHALPTGASFELDTDLSKLFPLEPGQSYEVRCRYDGVAVATEGLPPYPEQAHRSWTLRFEGTITLPGE